jgi:hypothetical protein
MVTAIETVPRIASWLNCVAGLTNTLISTTTERLGAVGLMHRYRGSYRNAAFAALFAVGFAGVSSAAPINGPAQIVPSTTLASSGSFTIDQIADGISSDPPYNGFSAVPGQVGTIRLDLDATYVLSSFVMWNDINVAMEGVEDFRLDFFDAANAPLGSSPVYTAGQGVIAAQTFLFTSPVPGVKRVDLVVLTLLPGPLGPRLEIREVAFDGDQPVPSQSANWGQIKSMYR